jgi:hypothetical protein
LPNVFFFQHPRGVAMQLVHCDKRLTHTQIAANGRFSGETLIPAC